MKELCEIAGVSRSGYYKWKKRAGAPPDAHREKTLRLVYECHKTHPSHGYRWVHAYLKGHEEGFDVSADYVRRCFGYLGIASKTKHKRAKQEPREVRDPYPQPHLQHLGHRRQAPPGHRERHDRAQAELVDVL